MFAADAATSRPSLTSTVSLYAVTPLLNASPLRLTFPYSALSLIPEVPSFLLSSVLFFASRLCVRLALSRRRSEALRLIRTTALP